MKKACSAKESKVVTTEDAENVLNVSEEDHKEQFTEEQLLINQKLLESGINDEGLGWLEKRNIFRTINVSLDTAGTDRLQRSSPRLAKAQNSKPSKWIENSFKKQEPEEIQNDSSPKTKGNKKDSESTPVRISGPTTKRSNQESPLLKPNLNIEGSLCEKPTKDDDIRSCSPKPGKKVQYIKIQNEENSKEVRDSSIEGVHEVSLKKKRCSQSETDIIEAPKKLRMEETNNGVSSEEETSLKTDLELERKKVIVPFKMRDIKAIVSECESRNKNWKETFSKYKTPTRWGTPIVGTCSEKWDGKQIPPKLLHRYQRYLAANNLTHPVFYPVKSPSTMDLNKLVCEMSCLSDAGEENSECKEESENDYKHLGEGSFSHGDTSGVGMENNLNASTSAKDNAGRMVLRNRNQQKTFISDEEEFSSDDSDDWLVKQKSSKKQKIHSKNRKAAEQCNKQLVLKLERCNLNRGTGGSEGGRKNGNKNEIGFTGGSTMSTNALTQAGISPKPVPDPDTMVCPICSLRFKKQHIESHATECASKTYKD